MSGRDGEEARAARRGDRAIQYMRQEDEASERFEEIKELFGPAFGPALEAYGRSLAERLLEDEGFRETIREQFEKGREQDRFPALSDYLTGRTNREIDEFFGTGWVDVALPQFRSAGRQPTCSPRNGNMEAYREDLYEGTASCHPDLRFFAQVWLEELKRVGYYGMEESLGLPLKQQADDLSAMPGPLPLYGEAFPARLGDSGQVVWLLLDGPRSAERGYHEISVSDEPLRTDRAILAALTSLEGRQIDVGRLRKVLPKIVPSRSESVWDCWTKVLEEGDHDREILQNLKHHQTLDYVLCMLRYHRPGFDDLPVEERAEFLAETSAYVNVFLDALRKLVSFLEHGVPGRRGPVPTRLIGRDVKAAVLKDVDGLTYREVACTLCIPVPADFGVKGDHPAVRRMVARGREVLEGALGEEGWLRQAEAMRAEASRWRSLDEASQEAEIEAEVLDLPEDKALRHRGSEKEQSSVRGRKSGVV